MAIRIQHIERPAERLFGRQAYFARHQIRIGGLLSGDLPPPMPGGAGVLRGSCRQCGHETRRILGVGTDVVNAR
jgi:hypothetical protein